MRSLSLQTKGQVKANFCESSFKIHASLCGMRRHKVRNPHCRGSPMLSLFLLIHLPTSSPSSSLHPSLLLLSQHPLPPRASLFSSVQCCSRRFDCPQRRQRWEWSDAVFTHKSDRVTLIRYLYPYRNQTDPFGLCCYKEEARLGGGWSRAAAEAWSGLVEAWTLAAFIVKETLQPATAAVSDDESC